MPILADIYNYTLPYIRASGTSAFYTTPEIVSQVGMEKKRFLGNLYIRNRKKITTQSEKNTDTTRLRFRGTLFRYIYNTLAKGSYKPFYNEDTYRSFCLFQPL